MSKNQKSMKKENEEKNIKIEEMIDENEKMNQVKEEDETNSENTCILSKMEEKLKTLEECNADYIKALQRERADFENFKKRNQAAVSESYASGMADTIAAVLPVLDNFERALGAVSEEEQEHPFTKGIFMVYKQLKDILKGFGLTEIEAYGEPFDPNFHHAVMQECATEGEKEGCVSEVFGKGYLLNGKVLRHTMVKVTGPAE